MLGNKSLFRIELVMLFLRWSGMEHETCKWIRM